tara:strand:+ start:214206 stop:214760 length:555 start_codon:yes stop_codon:yes gene_type:complete
MFLLSGGGAMVINLMVMAVFGGICAAIASGRGRSPIGWFFVGVVAPCLGIILVLVLPDLKVQEEREKRQRMETRKLREQLQKERQVSDQRHNHVERRLGAHDESLGIDTSNPPELPHTAAAAQLTNSDQWFYARDNERQGPVTEETIRHLLTAQAIDGDSLVWCDGMADWMPARDVAAFRGDVS